MSYFTTLPEFKTLEGLWAGLLSSNKRNGFLGHLEESPVF